MTTDESAHGEGKIDLERAIALGRMAIAIATPGKSGPGDVEAALDAVAEQATIEPEQVEESILQGVPYSGIPGAVEALGSWRRRSPLASAPGEPPKESLATVGAKIFDEVYGDLGLRVRSELRKRHPVLERWIIEFAYGRVMGRSRLPLADIEALGVASLLAQERRAPLHSHLRGARRAGWSVEELQAYLAGLEPWCDPETLAYARETVENLGEV